jgi:V/A-type H+-transporting ATPase subunit I
MLFGIILGDVGYGLVLVAIALLLHRRARPGSTVRTVSEIMGPCAAFTIIFGVLFGEFLGTAGHLWFGMEPLLFNREEALVPFLGLAVAIGVVHILLGLTLSVIAKAKSSPRHALGSGVMAFMVVLIVAAILSAVEVLPRAFFTPVVIALLVAFPVLVIAEGVVAAIELLSTLGHILSYARVMALGTASVMMAMAANRMVGAMGSVVVGVLFGLLFHLVNFALGMFSPTIHALRLHYVEFFGTFFSPGGVPYRPLRHWKPLTEGRSRG